ncbi:E3 ubiquitin-protein ligase PPP1R11-like [Monodelphis domestica]|nr:E3 ubiquitin-protein ligase PPP1R11-like [Monodelphis domestica]
MTTEPTRRTGENHHHRGITMKLQKRKAGKKVEWSSDTVDNEHLGRLSSKCCCIYEKPPAFGESSTENYDEDDDESCGHSQSVPSHRKRQHLANPVLSQPSFLSSLTPPNPDLAP